MTDSREAEARRRLDEVRTAKNPQVTLSNVFYDAGLDGTDQWDEDGERYTEEYGYDCDDLAKVLLPLIVGTIH